jgi:hypothetical protein
VALPGAYAPASIALRVIGARRPPLHDKEVVLKEERAYYKMLNRASDFDGFFATIYATKMEMRLELGMPAVYMGQEEISTLFQYTIISGLLVFPPEMCL